MHASDLRAPSRYYADRLARHATARDDAAAAARRLSNARGATFVAAVATVAAYDFMGGWGEIAALVALAACVLGFLAQVRAHRRVRRDEVRHAALARLAQEGLARLERRWDELPHALAAPEAPGDQGGVQDPPRFGDLGVIGHASLSRLLGPVSLDLASQRLRSWLSDPDPPVEVRARQSAVRELARERELRDEFAAHARLAGDEEGPGFGRLAAWAGRAPMSFVDGGTRWAMWFLPPLLVLTVTLDVVADVGPIWLLVAGPQLWISRRMGRAWGDAFAAAEVGARSARALASRLELIEERDVEAAVLSGIRRRLGHGSARASRGLRELGRILDFVESRRNMFYAALAPVLLLDAWLGRALERWRVRYAAAVEGWTDAVATWEALSALATVAHDHPSWSFPRLVGPKPPILDARGLGHPLLHPGQCVVNDVSVGPSGSFLLVTGSNMSGKSTLLRAIGLNAVLGAAGGPVCAEHLALSDLRVRTSMRVDDSLARGVSLFMAELLRIRDIVRDARAPDPRDRRVLYLLDEMLHGTNSADRRVAARVILGHLLAAGAVGAVSTHDLTLAATPDLAGAAKPVHFREEVREPTGSDAGTHAALVFDYRLRDGLSTTRNAIQLLDSVGLGEVDDEPTRS